MHNIRSTLSVGVLVSLLFLTWVASLADAQQLPITTRSVEARRLFERSVEQMGHFRLVEANTTLERAIRADSSFALAHVMLAFLRHYDARSGADVAEHAVRLAQQATPAEQSFAAAVRALETGNVAEATRLSRELEGAYPGSWLPTWLRSDVSFFKTRDFAEAETVLRAGLERHPEHNLLRNVLGYALLYQGKREEARVTFEKNAELHADEPNPWDSLGNLYRAMGMHEEAVSAYERGLHVDADFQFPKFFAPTHHRLGYAYLALGRHADAERAFGEYIRRRPADPNAYDSLGELYLRTGRYPEAIEQFERALAINPEFASSRENLVRTRIEQVNQAFGEAFGRRDSQVLAELYTRDAQLLPSGRGPVKGSVAVQQYWEAALAAGLTGADLETTEVYVGSGGETATEVGRYRLAAGDRVADEGKYMVLWRKTPQGWKIHRDIWTTDRAQK